MSYVLLVGLLSIPVLAALGLALLLWREMRTTNAAMRADRGRWTEARKRREAMYDGGAGNQ
jgi:hypothetical protein